MANIKAIEKRVEDINAMIAEANRNGISVIDTSSTWQTPMKYNQLKYSRGILYVTYKELDLYAYAKGRGMKWEKRSERYGASDVRYVLTDIARMYRRALK